MKKKMVECCICDCEFFTCKKKDKYRGYMCFECQEGEWDDYVSSVASAGMTAQRLTIKDWLYFDGRMHKQFLKEQNGEK